MIVKRLSMINKYIYGALAIIIASLSITIYVKEKELYKYKLLEQELEIRAIEAEKQNKIINDALERETKNIKIKYKTIYKEVTTETTCKEELDNRNEMLQLYIDKHSNKNIDSIIEPMEIVEDEKDN